MDGKSSRLRLLVIAALFAGSLIILPGRSALPAGPNAGSSASAQPVSASPSSGALKPPEHSAIAIINQYLCGYDSPNCAAYRDAQNGDYSIDTMIATVPDPIESGLASDFDDVLESIERALAKAEFLPDRFDLPWRPPGPDSTAASAPVETGLGLGETHSGAQSSNPESEPGAILFRKGDGKSLLVVFLIGETPTAGIHKAAFIRAARQICDLRAEFPPGKKGGSVQGPLKVMGPTYSGSARSLELAIEDARAMEHICGLDKIHIISGSATAVPGDEFKQISGINFSATALRNEAEVRALRDAFPGRGEFAYLTEEDTVYGATWSWRSKSVPKASDANASDPDQSGAAGVTNLQFPIHIAELENAAAAQQQKLIASGVSVPALGRQDLPLTSPAETRRDVVPLYSSATTATLELVLDQMLAALKDLRIRYVMIAATDVNDTIFLAGQVRTVNPNATVIALSSHVLYVHSEFNSALRGMLVASPYPLFIEDHLWNKSGTPQPIQFPSDRAEGAYNATLALLGETDKMLDYGSDQPPLWISVVGKNGLWPIAQIGVDDPHGYTYIVPGPVPSPAPVSVHLTRTAVGMFLILALTTLAYAGLASLAHARPATLPPAVVQHLGDAVFPEYGGKRRIAQLESAAIALALLVSFAIYLLPTGGWPGTFPATSIGGPAAVERMRVFRATHLGNGVSPLTPVLLASAAALALLFGSIRRRVLMETHQLLTTYLDFGTDSFEGVAALERGIRSASQDLLWGSWTWRIAVGLTILLYLAAVRTWRYLPLDGAFLRVVYLLISIVAYVAIANAIVRLVTLWLATRHLLHRMYWHPSRDGYARIREGMPGDKVSSIDLLSAISTMIPLEAGLEYARKIEDFECDEKASGQIPQRLNEARARLDDAINRTETRLKLALEADARRAWSAEIQHKRDAEQQAGVLSQCVANIFEPAWRKTTVESGPPKVWDKEDALVAMGEAYVATRVIDFLRAVMPHLRTLAISSTAAVLLMLLAASSYPFPFSDDLLWFGWALVIVAAVSTTWMFLSMNRDRVISLISGTTPGTVNWNSALFSQLLTHALIPLMVLLGAAFPQRFSSLLGWIGGILGGKG
jgi:hypothetical protein